MNVNAEQLAGATTNSIGDTSSASTAVGISIAVTIAVDTVEALVERSLIAGGSVTVQALGSSANKADAKASVSGAPNTEDDDSGENVNDKTDNQLGLLDDVSTENTGQSTGQTESPKATTSDSEDSDDSVAVAGALSLNIVLTKSRALLANGITIQAGGALTIRSSANSDAEGTADGTTVEATSTGVGVAIVLNYVEITNWPRPGNTTLSVNGLTVEAVMTTSPETRPTPSRRSPSPALAPTRPASPARSASTSSTATTPRHRLRRGRRQRRNGQHHPHGHQHGVRHRHRNGYRRGR